MNYRQKLILEKLAQEDVLTIASLAQELSVSKMTIHRDLDALQRAGLVQKGHGKVSLTAKLRGDDSIHCQMCGHPNRENLIFTIFTNDGKKAHFCCPHCGLMAYSHQENLWQTLATDFLYGHTITAPQAQYLINPDLKICCSPSVLAFASAEDALKFQNGFGGQVVNFNQAVDFLAHSNL